MHGPELYNTFVSVNPIAELHPKIGAFFQNYLRYEKAVVFDGRYVINTHFPPFPGPSFDNLTKHVTAVGSSDNRALYSVTLAVTNRCGYNCWHCYNAGRSLADTATETILETVDRLSDMNAVKVTLTGGEPLLRPDLEAIAARFTDKTTLVLNTTGFGLTRKRAESLKASGIFALGVSIDSADPAEHDSMRGKAGAFDTAVKALKIAADTGLYPYIISVATRHYLDPGRFEAFMEFAAGIGAREVHLLEPCATGTLAGCSEVTLTGEEKKQILEYQKEYAVRDDMPILSSFLYLESAEAFGCGAGLTHLYIDGSGEVSPCNLVPLSFGNVRDSSLSDILGIMGNYFRKPRTECIGQTLSKHIPPGKLPLSPAESKELCEQHLSGEHDVPAFFRAQEECLAAVGENELKEAYDTVHGSYDEFWVSEAGKPVNGLIDELGIGGGEKIFEAGCGTGYATSILANAVKGSGMITAADISAGMLREARSRLNGNGASVDFRQGDALAMLGRGERFDLVFSSWVLGYIPLEPFIARAAKSLVDGGRLAFIVHRENSPARELAIFEDLVKKNPSALTRQVAFDFPKDTRHVGSVMARAGFVTHYLAEGEVTFSYGSAEEVLEHLLKSGAGTAFYDAVSPEWRDRLARLFVDRLRRLNGGKSPYKVVHEYIACIGTWYH